MRCKSIVFAITLLALSFVADGAPVRRHAPSLRPPVVTNAAPRMVRAVRRTMTAEEAKATVDVLIAFDRGAREWAATTNVSLRFVAEVAVWRANKALENTGLRDKFEFQLAGVMCVNDRGDDVEDVIERICSSGDPTDRNWNAVQRERDRIGADIAMTLIDTGTEYGTVGISYAWMAGDDGSGIREFAFGVCAVRSVWESHTMTHEIGHILAAGHAEDIIEEDPGLCDYGHGYYFTGTNGVPYHTIMAYDEDEAGNRYEEAPYFSSPSNSYIGAAVGTASNDNTRVILQTYRTVAAFRERVEDPATNVIIRFDTNGASAEVADLVCASNKVYNLPMSIPDGDAGTFRSWFRRDAGKVYDPGLAVFNLAPAPKTIVMEAIWE